MRSGTIKVPVLRGLGAALACPTAAQTWAGGACTQAACAAKQPGAKGACKKFGIPWGAPVVASPAPIPAGQGPFFAPAVPVPFGSGLPPTPAPNPPLPPLPSSPPPTPACTTDWAAATSDVMAVIDSIRSCANPTAALPAEISACPAGSGTGSGSYGDYTSARSRYHSAIEDASILCAASTQQPASGSPYTYPSQPSTYSPYTPYGQNQYGQVTTPQPDDSPMIAPETKPFIGKRGAIGIGGVVLAGALLWFIMHRKKTHRA